MNIGLFGGTFDPIHRGHIALARAALERCNLTRIHFVPVGMHPLKGAQPMATYFDRYAMVALATQGKKAFVPSLLEAPEVDSSQKSGKERAPNFSIDTVRKLKQTLKKIDRLFFLVGIDAFKDIAKWHEPEALLRECTFIVASRPGFSLADVANSLPESLRPSSAVTKPFQRQPAKGDLVLSGVTIHLLDSVNQAVSATAIRQAVAAKRPLGKLLDSKVEEYIKKRGFYGGRGEK
ncbi:MAG TPA: nicotinate (nicotinamide) nucleotide adenylyltransferase [Terriglobales bacterium]|jgi:nicotinate-nucleotide adenylyltransferase